MTYAIRKLFTTVLSATWVLVGCNSDKELPPDGTGSALPVVPYNGGETTDFGSDCDPSYGGDPTDRSDVLEYLKAHPDEIASEIEGTREAALLWEDCIGTDNDCANDTLALTLWVDELMIPEEATATQREQINCTLTPWVRALAQMSTKSGRLSGAFYAQLYPSFEGYWNFWGSPDLRNFKGSAPLTVETQRPHWAVLYARFNLGDRLGGVFEGRAWYTDSDDPSDAQVMPEMYWGSRIEEIVNAEYTPSPWSPPNESITLDEYEGSAQTPRLSVSVRVIAADKNDKDATVDLRVAVDGEETLYKNLNSYQTIDLGKLPRGTEVVAEALNTHGAAKISVTFRVFAGCRPSASCTEPNCTAHIELLVEPLICTQTG